MVFGEFFTIECGAQPIGERFLVGAGHDDHGLGDRKPQVRGPHHDQAHGGITVRVVGVQVRVTAPAPWRKMGLPGLALGPEHAAPLRAGLAFDRCAERPASAGIQHLEVRMRGPRAFVPLMNPQPIGELIKVSVGAGEQVRCRYRRALLRASGFAASGASAMSEPGEVRPIRVLIGVMKTRQRPQIVAAGAA